MARGTQYEMRLMRFGIPGCGVEHGAIAQKINQLIPDYMVMGERGMADMTEMAMPLPDNTVPMMGGDGPFGSLEMGGMFTMLKVRRDQKPGDYRDPGWFAHPPGTVAHEFTGSVSEPARAAVPAATRKGVEVRVRKPRAGHEGHH